MIATWERQLADGRAIMLRSAVPGDATSITRLYLGLSSLSYERRFQTVRPAPDVVARLARLDAGRCLVAFLQADPEHLIGEARYVPTGAETAEFALTVLDSYQGLGLGPLLLDGLAEQARYDGLDRLRAVVLLSNTPMLRLLRHQGWVLAEPTDDCHVAYLEISTDGGMPGWSVDSTGPRMLVERRDWFDDEQIAQLRSAGLEVRHCAGPFREAGWLCPLLTSGTCRLADEADIIVSRLPPSEPDSAAIRAVHRRKWAHKLAE